MERTDHEWRVMKRRMPSKEGGCDYYDPPPRTSDHCAILAPGPSLDISEVPEGAELFGINGAVSIHECRWWVFNDNCAANYFKPIGNPSPIPKMSRFWLNGFPKLRHAKGWSVGLAVEAAIWMGFTHIPIYGATFAGTEHCYPPAYEGESATSAYGPFDRWQSERRRLERLQLEALERFGVRVVRVHAEESESPAATPHADSSSRSETTQSDPANPIPASGS